MISPNCPSKKTPQSSKIVVTQEKKKLLLWSVLIIDSAVNVNALHPGVPEVRQQNLNFFSLLCCVCNVVCSHSSGEWFCLDSLPVNKLLLVYLLTFFFLFCTLLRMFSKYHRLVCLNINICFKASSLL